MGFTFSFAVLDVVQPLQAMLEGEGGVSHGRLGGGTMAVVDAWISQLVGESPLPNFVKPSSENY